MSLPEWPSTLPKYPLRRGFEETVRSPVDEFDTDQGPPQQRLRSVSEVRIYSMTIWIVGKDQLNDFNTFYRTTVRKVKPFLWIEHSTDDPMVYQFDNTSPPVKSPIGPFEWEISMVLFGLPEQVPN